MERLDRRVWETVCAVYRAAGAVGVRVVEVIVYGSWARGDWLSTSDLDLVVVGEGWHGSLVERPDPIYRLLAEMRPPIWPQLLCYTPSELQEALGKVTHLRDASRYWVRIPASLLEEKCKGLEKGS